MAMSKKKLVVLTGAGMSAESGLKTFRDSGGLWEEYDVMEVCSTEGWYKNPNLVLEFYNKRREQLLDAKPNTGHLGLVELETLFDVQIITQNVDNLHEAAGSLNVLHLHGELMKARSAGNPNLIYQLTKENWKVNPGDLAEDGTQLRPHIVFFGEAVPAMDDAIPLCEQADIFVVVGTSMAVYPAASLIHYIPNGTPVFVIDPQAVALPSGSKSEQIQLGAEEGVKLLIEKLKAYA